MVKAFLFLYKIYIFADEIFRNKLPQKNAIIPKLPQFHFKNNKKTFSNFLEKVYFFGATYRI